MDKGNKVLIFQSDDGAINVTVELKDETLWLNQNQLADLFGTKQPAISKHLNNIFKSGELEKDSVHSILEYTANDGKTYKTGFYNLDMIISLGYRVNSQRATQFRIWATKVLKDHIVKGYTLNQKRLNQKGLEELNRTIALLQTSLSQNEIGLDEAKGLLDIILTYSRTWSLLQGYDEDSLPELSSKTDQKFILDFDEAKAAIARLKNELIQKGEATELFGREKANEFDGIIRNIYQTFGGNELLPGVEDKAANLLYYIIKDHPFNDGNKRIGAFLFILFLDKNRARFKPNGELKINDNALVALALMTAKSLPEQKDTVVRLIVNMLGEG